MVFSSTLFVFLFLVVVLALYYSLGRRLRNLVLLLASLLFYAWGETYLVTVLALSIVANWIFGLWVERAVRRGSGKLVVAVTVAFNIGLLVAFKYSDWLWSILGHGLSAVGAIHGPLPELGTFLPESSALHELLVNSRGHVRLPLGVSFFTFQATSYVIDVYRRDVEPERSLVNFGMYKALFPQLIAGPIVRYRDVHDQIRERVTTRAGFATGVRRFVTGLGKKMLVANIAAQCADGIFGSPTARPPIPGVPLHELTPPVAWLGVLCYTLQIYFDFSGYSDMAIGLGHMFGFRFLENFDYPYVARSITEFWRRWHISLSTWFRDYLYIPLGGNRGSPARTYANLLLVFFLCGLWHGAAFNFVVWGLFHGVFLVVERVGLGAWLARRASILRHAYVLLAVMVGWVFFRANNLTQASAFLKAMSGLQRGRPEAHHVDLWLDPVLATALVCGVIGAMPWLRKAVAWQRGLEERGRPALGLTIEVAGLIGLALVLFASALELSSNSYNPFIYFRF
jgi:alginate O-acetyltransferase complex protein AlgI